ncbi:FixH family protein [Stieleria varia]|nr:FixH family protein [Stieleria varia]
MNHQCDDTSVLRAQARRAASLRCYEIIRCMALVLTGILAVSVNGCQSPAEDMSKVQVDLTLEPSEPVVGNANVMVRLTDTEGTLIEKADVQVEGNMNHAGMKPSFAEMTESEPGLYSGTLDFTMGGDWFLLVSAKMPDGTTVERKFDVPRVKVQ